MQRLVLEEGRSTPACEYLFFSRYALFPFIHYAAEPPRIISQPVNQKDILPGKAVAFSVQSTGTEPLGYQWQWKPAGEGDRRDEWQDLSCGVSLQGVNTPTLTFSNVQSCNDGLYRCVITNRADKMISDCAELTVGK